MNKGSLLKVASVAVGPEPIPIWGATGPEVVELTNCSSSYPVFAGIRLEEGESDECPGLGPRHFYRRIEPGKHDAFFVPAGVVVEAMRPKGSDDAVHVAIWEAIPAPASS